MDTVDEERFIVLLEGIKILNRVTRLDHLCVVFDIDDTLIDSMDNTSIDPMIYLYHRLEGMRIPIFIITARNEEYAEYTRKQLLTHGIDNYESLYMVGNHDGKGQRKAQIRAYIESMGYDILLNIGDDSSDFIDDHFIYGLKLPSYYE